MARGSMVAVSFCLFVSSVNAGHLKFHKVPCEIEPQQVATINAVMDVGYYIHILDQTPVYIGPDASIGNPYFSYSGCKETEIVSNFAARFELSVISTSPAGGYWQAKVHPEEVHGKVPVEMCVYVRELAVAKLDDPSKPAKVAEMRVRVYPAK